MPTPADIKALIEASQASCARLEAIEQEANTLTEQVESINQSLGYRQDKQQRILHTLKEVHPQFESIQSEIKRKENEIGAPDLTAQELRELIHIPGHIEVPSIKAAPGNKKSKIYL